MPIDLEMGGYRDQSPVGQEQFIELFTGGRRLRVDQDPERRRIIRHGPEYTALVVFELALERGGVGRP